MKIQRHSVSTALLSGVIALALTALLMVIPWTALTAITKGDAKLLDWSRGIVFVCSPVLVVLFFLVVRYFYNHRQAPVLNGTRQLAWVDLPHTTLIAGLRTHFPVMDSVAMHIRGNIESIQDPGGPLRVSPRSYLMRGQRVLIFPAVLWKRLQQSPEALGAVLAHELAHFQHRDIELLGFARRLLWAICFVFLGNYLIDMYASIQSDFADTANGLDWAVLQASLAGKSFTFSGLFFLIISAAYIRSLEHWREALADLAAVSCQGEDALASAERLISRSSDSDAKPVGVRPSRLERNTSIILTPYHWLLIGGVVVLVSTNLIGQFAYLLSQQKDDADGIYAWVTGVLSNLLPFGGFLLLFGVILNTKNDNIELNGGLDFGLIARPALLLVLGGSLGFLLSQAVPLALTSVSMPDGYDYVYKHDPGSLLISSTLSELGLNSWLVVLALLGVVAALVSGKWPLAWLPGVLWAGGSVTEQNSFPSFMLGGFTPLIIFLFATPFLVMAYRRRLIHARIAWLPIIVLASLYWSGLGDINHLSSASSKAAVLAESRGDWTQAIELRRRAVLFAPGLAEPKLALASSMARSGGMLDEAIQVAESATDSPLSSSWQDRFLALKLAGDLHFQRRSRLDLVQASRRYIQAEALWRNNSRLPSKQVAELLYNQACAEVLQAGPSLKTVAGLVEALALDHSLASTMLQDDDLRALNLGRIPPLTRVELQKVLLPGRMGAPQLVELAKERQLDANYLSRALSALVHHYASGT